MINFTKEVTKIRKTLKRANKPSKYNTQRAKNDENLHRSLQKHRTYTSGQSNKNTKEVC